MKFSSYKFSSLWIKENIFFVLLTLFCLLSLVFPDLFIFSDLFSKFDDKWRKKMKILKKKNFNWNINFLLCWPIVRELKKKRKLKKKIKLMVENVTDKKKNFCVHKKLYSFCGKFLICHFNWILNGNIYKIFINFLFFLVKENWRSWKMWIEKCVKNFLWKTSKSEYLEQ